MTRLPISFFAALSLAGGCIATKPIGPDQSCPCAPGWTCDESRGLCVDAGGSGAGGAGTAGSPDAGAGGASGLPSYAAADVQAALAQCDLPHGPPVSSATYGDKRALMLGAWIECPPTPATVFYPAIVFAVDGTWQHLLSDGNGGLAPGFGVQNQGNYSFPFPDTEPTTNNNAGVENPYVTVSAASFDFAPAGFSDGPMTLETSPSRIHVIISYLDQNIEVWLVRLPTP
jgi:hypothetical protein